MKDSTVTIKGLTRIQANTLAIMFEDGKIGEALNEKLEKMNMGEHKLDDDVPSVDFDENENDVDHEVDFDN